MEEPKRVPVSVYAEMTPNPSVLKFVANKHLVEQSHVEFKNIEEAQISPLAIKLFHLPFVKEVFISSNYIAVTKYDIVEWEDITMELRELIREYIATGQKILTSNPKIEEVVSEETQSTSFSTSHPEAKSEEDYEEIVKKIVSLLEEYVAPAVGADGGHIKFLKLEDKTVKVLLQGACSGCPSSTQTLKQGIQNLLQQMLPGQIDDVVAVNG